MGTLFALLARSKRAALTASVLSIFAGLLTTAVMAALERLVANPSGISNALIVALGVLIMLVTTTVSQYLLIRLSGRMITDIALAFTERILRAPLRQLEQIGPGRILAAQTQDVAAIATGALVLPPLLSNTVICAACLAYLAWHSPKLFGVLGLVTLAGVAVVLLIKRVARRYEERARELIDVAVAHMRQLAEGTKELKLSRAARDNFVGHGMGKALSNVERAQLAGASLHSIAGAAGRAGVFISIGTVVVAAALLGGDSFDSRRFAFVILFASGPLGMLLSLTPLLMRANASLKMIRRLGLSLTAEPESARAPGQALSSHGSRIELRGVSHCYEREDGTRFTLGPLDLDVTPSTILFVVGGNGSGKSTLVKLLVGLYAPETGEIRVDGVALPEFERDWYRDHFSVVFADYFLPEEFELPAGIGQHLAALGLLARINPALPTVRTTELSSGQRRRLALARACVEDRPFYVFDEWAADQDPSYKELFYRRFLPELRARHKAVVVVTHDDRFFDVADRVLKLEDGRATWLGARPTAHAAGQA